MYTAYHIVQCDLFHYFDHGLTDSTLIAVFPLHVRVICVGGVGFFGSYICSIVIISVFILFYDVDFHASGTLSGM